MKSISNIARQQRECARHPGLSSDTDNFLNMATWINEEFPNHPPHHPMGNIATIVMPVINNGERVLLYEVNSGLNKGRTGFPGGKVDLRDICEGWPSTPYDYGSGAEELGLNLEALQRCGARETEEETREKEEKPRVETAINSNGTGLRMPHEVLALACFYSVLYSPGSDKPSKTQQVATMLVDISDTMGGFDSPGSEVKYIGEYTPKEALDAMKDTKAPEGNIEMAKRALMMGAHYRQKNGVYIPVYGGKISYPEGEGWEKPLISQRLYRPYVLPHK